MIRSSISWKVHKCMHRYIVWIDTKLFGDYVRIISPKKNHAVADYRDNQPIEKPPCTWIFSLSLSLYK